MNESRESGAQINNKRVERSFRVEISLKHKTQRKTKNDIHTFKTDA